MQKRKIFYSKLFDKLFPIPRSITGTGYRNSLKIISKYIPFKIFKFKTGSQIFDWKVPYEWEISRGFLKKKNGIKICDFEKNNISILNYSKKVKLKTSFKYLKNNIFTIPSHPNLRPYVTSYYKKNWGFSVPYRIYKNLKDDDILDAQIESKFKNGSVDIGVKTLKGKKKKIVLISSYLCHPSMANNELSGPLVMIGLYNYLSKLKDRNFTYTFLINPETIGSLCFLKKFKNTLKKNLFTGFVLTCLGGKRKLSYKITKNEKSFLDKIFQNLKKYQKVHVRDFDPTSGSDERQYNSPGFNCPVGQISKLVYGTYKEYHTDGDNKQLMGIENILTSINQIIQIISVIELAGKISRKMPYGEIFLSKYNLYPHLNFNNKKAASRKNKNTKIILQILSYSDGEKDLVDIANKIKKPVIELINPIKTLINKKIIFVK